MNCEEIRNEIYLQSKRNDIEVRMVTINHLDDLKKDIEERYQRGLFDEAFYQDYLGDFNFALPEDLPDAKSLIIAAVPDPKHEIVFHWKRRTFNVIVPPTYLHWQQVNERAEKLITQPAAHGGFKVIRRKLPAKLLGGRSGLGQYGRNAILYIKAKGSFHRLVSFISDLPCSHDEWRDLEPMDACKKCTACIKKCPTAAITKDSFIIRAERCLTYHNEKPGDVPFPAWIDISWHNCLVGCMVCQTVCPANRVCMNWVVKSGEFTEEEVDLILKRTKLEEMPGSLVEKLKRCDLAEGIDLIARNLTALINR